MKLRFWGARGSIPTPITTTELRNRLREILARSKGIDLSDPIAIERHIQRLPATLNTIASGNTSCVELRINNQLFILDMGSGIRNLGTALMQENFVNGTGEAYIFISHTHYDHLEGFPFFTPQFIPGNQFHFQTPYPDLEERLQEFMRHPFFPVGLDYPQGTRTYTYLDPSVMHQINGVSVSVMKLNHPGDCYAYRFEHDGKVIVYATDGEYHSADPEATAPYEAFFQNADVLIFDAMYSYEDTVNNKVDWGHSTPKIGAEFAWRSGVKRLILTHHDPNSDDATLWAKVDDADSHLRHRAMRQNQETMQPVEVLLAREGLEIEL